MPSDPVKVGKQILALRKIKGMTQNELGEKLGVSFQAVSKWERGETLPDTAILPDLADALETTADNLLRGGESVTKIRRKITIEEMREGIACFERIGELLGKDSTYYIGAVEGIEKKMDIEFEKYLQESFTRECMIAEAAIQCVQNGAYLDPSDIKNGFEHEHWVEVVTEYANKYSAQ